MQAMMAQARLKVFLFFGLNIIMWDILSQNFKMYTPTPNFLSFCFLKWVFKKSGIYNGANPLNIHTTE